MALLSIIATPLVIVDRLTKLCRTVEDFNRPSTRELAESQLRRDTVALGAGVGTIVGATAGAAWGHQVQGGNIVRETTTRHPITQDVLEGYHHSTQTLESCQKVAFREGCRQTVQGWWHNYSPDIDKRVVGHFEQPSFSHSSFLTPISGAFLGGVAGAISGALVGSLVGTLRSGQIEARKLASDNYTKEALDKRENSIAGVGMIGAVVGAAAGGALGLKVAAQESAHSVVRTWHVPVYEQNVELGRIPAQWYEDKGFIDLLPSSGDGRPPSVPVYGQQPRLDETGHIQMAPRTERLDAARISAGEGLFRGALVGAGVGLATGVAAGVLYHTLAEPEKEKSSGETPFG